MILNPPRTKRPSGIFIAITCYLVLSAVLVACDRNTPQNREYKYTIFTFGTLVDITIFGTSAKQAERAFQQLQHDFDQYHDEWSPWTQGELAQLNQKLLQDIGKPVPAGPHLLPLIRESMQLSKQTDSLFDPAIGKLINLWQFHRYQEADIHPPDADAISKLVQQNPKMSDLTITADNQVINQNPAMLLNFGAYAKGYGIELAMNTLHRFGINNAVINAGGDLAVSGEHGDREWNIGIRNPRKDSILASVQVAPGESVFTSGDYERVYEYKGKRYHHILDPRTGYPTQDAESVTVIHTHPALADAMATALMVAGRDRWFEIAKKNHLEYVMLIDSDGNIHITPAMYKRVKFIDKPPTNHIIVSEQL